MISIQLLNLIKRFFEFDTIYVLVSFAGADISLGYVVNLVHGCLISETVQQSSECCRFILDLADNLLVREKIFVHAFSHRSHKHYFTAMSFISKMYHSRFSLWSVLGLFHHRLHDSSTINEGAILLL